MSKMLKKIIAIGTISVLMGAAFVGCAKDEKPADTPTTPVEDKKEDDKSAETSDVEKPEKIKLMINVGAKIEDGAMEWRDEYERLTGIELDYNGPESGNDYYTNLDLAFSAKKSPDVFNIGDGRFPAYVAQGALADLTDLFNNSEVLSKIDPKIMESITLDGKIYGIPFEAGGGPITYVRQDMMDGAGITAAPTNYDEFIEMLRAFKATYPEKIPYTAPSLYEGEAVLYLREFYQDATPEFAEVDGEWVDGMSQPNMIPALQRLQDAYGEGLIDQEIITNTTATCRDKWYAGEIGVFNYWAGTWAQNLEVRLQANVPEASVLQLPSIEETVYLQRAPVITAISSQADNIEGIFKYFLEYMHDGAEGQILFESGVEDLHWAQDGDNLKQLPKMSQPDEVAEKAFISPFYRVTPLINDDKKIDYDERVTSSIEVLTADGAQLTTLPLSKSYTKMSSDLIALKSATIAEIVMGEVTVEEGLAHYKTEAEALGIDTVIAELNE